MNHADAHDRARLTRAVMRLSSARREKLEKVDFETFVEGLADLPVDIVEQVCLDFGRIAPEEYQPRFPPLYMLRESCIRAQAVARERLALKSAKPERPADLTEGQRKHLRELFQRSLPSRPVPAWLRSKDAHD